MRSIFWASPGRWKLHRNALEGGKEGRRHTREEGSLTPGPSGYEAIGGGYLFYTNSLLLSSDWRSYKLCLRMWVRGKWCKHYGSDMSIIFNIMYIISSSTCTRHTLIVPLCSISYMANCPISSDIGRFDEQAI